MIFAALGAAQAATPAQSCQGGKNKAAGKYDGCRQTAEAKLATTGDGVKYADTLAKCQAKYAATWAALEAKAAAAGAACPSVADEAAIQTLIDGTTTSIATALAGGPLVSCPSDLDVCTDALATCSSQLTTCQASPQGVRLKTGQTYSYGPSDDGLHEKGLARSYTDNGNGTITDNQTGLTWEKLSDDASIHDWGNVYGWIDAMRVKVPALNDAHFGGYTDWRLPNIEELRSLRNVEARDPAVFSPFHANCTPGCTVLTCACTFGREYWTSTLGVFPHDDSAWIVNFQEGYQYWNLHTALNLVRCVRGG